MDKQTIIQEIKRLIAVQRRREEDEKRWSVSDNFCPAAQKESRLMWGAYRRGRLALEATLRMVKSSSTL